MTSVWLFYQVLFFFFSHDQPDYDSLADLSDAESFMTTTMA